MGVFGRYKYTTENSTPQWELLELNSKDFSDREKLFSVLWEANSEQRTEHSAIHFGIPY